MATPLFCPLFLNPFFLAMCFYCSGMKKNTKMVQRGPLLGFFGNQLITFIFSFLLLVRKVVECQIKNAAKREVSQQTPLFGFIFQASSLLLYDAVVQEQEKKNCKQDMPKGGCHCQHPFLATFVVQLFLGYCMTL